MASQYHNLLLASVWPFQIHPGGSKSLLHGTFKRTAGRASDVRPIGEDMTSLSTVSRDLFVSHVKLGCRLVLVQHMRLDVKSVVTTLFIVSSSRI